jgi:predicted  nucleic acid-binding Zn-ribbon protein
MSTLADLSRAIAGLDFTIDNAELTRLKAEHADLQGKRDMVREEIRSLTDRISTYSGPDPVKVAEAIMAGTAPADAAAAGVSRVELEERRDALISSLDPIRERIDRLGEEIEDTKSAITLRIHEAFRPYVAAVHTRQREAAETLLQCDAELIALGAVCNRHLDDYGASRKAREGVTGSDTLLGWRDVIPVPADLLAALRPLDEKCAAVAGVPDRIATR